KLKFQGSFVVRRIFVFTSAILIDRDGHVRGGATWEGFGEEQARIRRAQGCAGKQKGSKPTSNIQDPTSGFHDTAFASRRALDWWFAWQMATATASQASSESMVWLSPRRECTMSCTWRFSARP